MKKFIHFLVLILIVSLASCQKLEDIFEPSKDKKGKTYQTDNIEAVHLFLADENGKEPTDPKSKVYESRKMNPVLAPNGHHLTLEEFDAVKGKLTMTCTQKGTRIDLKMEGLIPFATYSVWVLVFEAPGFTPDFAHEIAEGVPGGNEGFRSSFVAGSDGKATYSEIVPEGPMSFFGSVTHCLLDEYEVHIVGAYHLDGQTYGGELGPDGKAVEQFGWMYQKKK
jgi:hypothetical protein